MVVVGLALAIGAVRFSGLSRASILASPAEAQAAFALDFPDERPRRALVSADAKMAVLELTGGRAGLVLCFGSRTVTRVLSPASVSGVERRGEAIALHMRDFTLPVVRTSFAVERDAEAAEAILTGRRMTEEQHA